MPISRSYRVVVQVRSLVVVGLVAFAGALITGFGIGMPDDNPARPPGKSHEVAPGPHPALAFDPLLSKQFPFFPSAQTTPDGKKVVLEDYESNARCIRCHKKIGQEWSGSMHAAAMKDPVFLALYQLGHKETKGFTDRLCAGCHSSPMVISGHSAPHELAKLDQPVSDGVSCVVCHSINKCNLTQPGSFPANGSFVTDPKGPIIGPHGDRPCKSSSSRETVKSDLLTKSEFCANCHGAVHPLNGFVIEKTYDEWKNSIYAAKGIQCQDCHMQPVELALQTAKTLKKVPNPGKVSVSAPMRDHVYSHTFVGANVAVTRLLGANEHAQMAEKLLKGAASLELSLPGQARAGTTVQLRVKVNNETAGHSLPTSLVEVRQMWLDIQVKDVAGKELYRSGAVDAKGTVDPDAVMFHAIAVDQHGKHTVKPWEMVRFSYYHTVPARGHTLERFAFAVPKGAKGPVTVRATLRYRSYPQDLAVALLGKNAPAAPIIDMTVAEKKLEIAP